jgi:hypothetical protein
MNILLVTKCPKKVCSIVTKKVCSIVELARNIGGGAKKKSNL